MSGLKGPRVSVSVVTFNHENFIGPCLESVLAQKTDFDFEVIVGEDHSTDGTRDVIASLARRDPRLRPLFRERNVGVRQNWQEVLDACGGDYIAHIDGDDLWRPGKLQKQADWLDAHPRHSCCFHNVRVFDSDSGQDLGNFTRPGTALQITLDDCIRRSPVYVLSSKMWRRSSLQSRVDPGLTFVLDWWAQIESARHGRIGYLDEVLGEYRKHAGAFTSRSRVRHEAFVRDQLRTLEWASALEGVSPAAIEAGRARVLVELASLRLDDDDLAGFAAAVDQTEGLAPASLTHLLFRLLRDAPRVASFLQRLRQRLRGSR